MNDTATPLSIDDQRLLAANTERPFVDSVSQLQTVQLFNSPVLVSKAREKNIALMADGTLLCIDPFEQSVRTVRKLASREGMAVQISVATQQVIDSVLAGLEDDVEASNDDAGFQVEDDSQAKLKLREVIENGLKFGSSDIHLEIRGTETRVKYRMLGRLREKATLTGAMGKAIANVAFRVFAQTDFNPVEIEQGSFDIHVANVDTRIRINYQPCGDFGDVVMRFLSNSEDSRAPALHDLGFSRLHQEILESNVRKGDGIILVAGPTGSGKTTTLASVLDTIEPDRKIYTLEDPVEKIIENASQINIGAAAEDSDGLADQYHIYQKNILRQDPDDVMIGEVRDLSVAETAIHMATTGHMAFATIHTNGALAILTRLNDIGISWQKLSSPGLLRALSYQRLTPLLCEHCKIPYADRSDSHALIGCTSQVSAIARIDDFLGVFISRCETNDQQCAPYVADTRGCKHCDEGFSGRSVLAEIINVDREARRFIREGDLLGLEEYLIERGWETITDHAMHLIRLGLVDPYYADRIVGPIGGGDDESRFDYKEQRVKIANRYSKLSDR